jgi:ankyrin repeat protein
MHAAQNGHGKAIAVLIRAGADANAKSQMGGTLLMLAAQSGNSEAIAKVLEAGADVNEKGQASWTPLILAASLDRRAVADDLQMYAFIANKKPSSAEVRLRNRKGWTRLTTTEIMKRTTQRFQFPSGRGKQV